MGPVPFWSIIGVLSAMWFVAIVLELVRPKRPDEYYGLFGLIIILSLFIAPYLIWRAIQVVFLGRR